MEKCKRYFLTSSDYHEQEYFLFTKQVSLALLFFKSDLKQKLQHVVSMELKCKKVILWPGLKKKK